MSRTGITERGRREISSLLSAHFRKPIVIHEFKALVKKRILPSAQKLGWEPEFCIQSANALLVVHQLIQDQIPEQVKATPRTANFPKGHHRKPAFKQITPVVFCPETPATPETPEIKGIK